MLMPACALPIASHTQIESIETAAAESMEATDSACEIARLPKDLLAAVISLTTPWDACRAAAVSPTFLAASESDDVWSCFLPPDDFPLLAGWEIQPTVSSKKVMFMSLSDGPIPLADGLLTMWLDRESGAKCYMLSVRALRVVGGKMPLDWRSIPLYNSSFQKDAKIWYAYWMEITGKMDSWMLSQNTKYAAYMIFKIDDQSCGLDYPLQKVVVNIAGNRSSREVCLQGHGSEEDEEEVPEKYRHVMDPSRCMLMKRKRHVTSPGANVQLPKKRTDGWMELEVTEFSNKGYHDEEVCITLMETRPLCWKNGLIVHGIEIRVKK